MSAVRRIAREEWRWMVRSRIAIVGLALIAVLTVMASISAREHRRSVDAERARHQELADREFANQPDRHPHRVAHYGHFLFRPLPPLAAIDPGVDPYTGTTLFIEAHRQNGANFADVRQSSLLLRFGQLTPAFILQVLAPLLLIFAGHASLARERSSGTLRLLLAQGATGGSIMAGKVLALAGFAGLMLAPAILALVWIGVGEGAATLSLALLAAGNAAWLSIWVLAVTAVSAMVRRPADALLALLAIWATEVVLLPRWLPAVASGQVTLPTRYETEIAVERDYLKLGDPHDSADPRFAAFRDRMLKRYGVRRIEDLPVNFQGLVGAEGERQSSALFDRYAAGAAELQHRQNRIVDGFGWLAPMLSLRRLSMASAGTDLASYQRFFAQAEDYRYGLVQRLNHIQAAQIHYADDVDPDSNVRVSHENWRQVPPFHYVPAAPSEKWREAAPAGLVLLAWLFASIGFVVLATRRLAESVR